MIIVVTASREITRAAHGETVKRWLEWTAGMRQGGPINPDHELWDGLADGGDTVAHDIAVEDFGWKERRFPANWRDCSPIRVPDCEPCTPAHRKPRPGGRGDYCPTAGFRRNQLMIDTLVDIDDRKVVMGFPIPRSRSCSRGTFDCLHRAALAEIVNFCKPLQPAKGRTS